MDREWKQDNSIDKNCPVAIILEKEKKTCPKTFYVDCLIKKRVVNCRCKGCKKMNKK